MFKALINDAKAAAGAAVEKYALRASVAVPFVVAAGFGTAATTLALVEKFGPLAAYGIMAGGFAVIGLLAAAIVTAREQEVEVQDAGAAKADTAEVASDATTQAALQLPLALLGTLLTSPMGPGVVTSGLKGVVRNLPLVLLTALIALLLLWPASEDAEEETQRAPATPPAEPAGAQAAVDTIDRYAA